ncbi:hypothetical protein AUC70_12585 [Methyloceanibacter stevinii]|uniref:Polysaccharide biosynthesis protein C-terminal domain-containing protein n=1 Tax=Methyloceanibacter stevinii TaxID=1774970 RepID=A0A1E3VJH9_9HYPH|nr:hypothetical protein [Methyloceanibacter stevinii]ODR93665.1 hypothetical protein AUC70_12585 [Methyloceanibacter stevinii]
MTEKHIAYYLGSKVMAALINLGALALFVRIGGTETYAAYLIMFAWAYILYGVTVQWLKFSFFACYKDDCSSDLVSTYLGVLGLGLIAIFVLLFLGYVLGFETAQFGIGLVALILGLSLYEALLELARIRLHSRVVAAGILIRAVLMLTLGVLSLVVYGTALGLALAVGAAHLGASIPLLVDGRDKVEPKFSADAHARCGNTDAPWFRHLCSAPQDGNSIVSCWPVLLRSARSASTVSQRTSCGRRWSSSRKRSREPTCRSLGRNWPRTKSRRPQTRWARRFSPTPRSRHS